MAGQESEPAYIIFHRGYQWQNKGGYKMAFTEVYVQPQRWDEFMFFATVGEDGSVSETVAPGVIWKLKELRVHLSVAFASVEDLVFRISADAGQGSAFNFKFLSQAMNGVIDYQYIPAVSDGMIFQSADLGVITMSGASANNVIGIVVIGWAVRG